jgi:hypothetical protein
VTAPRGWETVIVGSSAGALIGLQFVVPTLVLFGIGAAALLLLFVGIHNAWDGVGLPSLYEKTLKK